MTNHRWGENTIHMYTDTSQKETYERPYVYEKMLHIINHQENVNSYYSESPLYTQNSGLNLKD